jgi:selenocysteine-specific elongation factor
MHVIATAGHVDHGKSTLVRVLTGINPDRLREEQRREMTIDLGFAWLTLPGGEPIGIVDVPGHIDFIDNMLAGIGGIDLALIVIAADEGPMPQTREHLAILHLLQVRRAVVALTKCDMVDAEWVDMMRSEAAQLLDDTPLQHAPIIPVSARTGAGLPDLTHALAAALAQTPARRDVNRPRLSVDRSFSLTGFGTVVTGTLVDGALAVGDAVELVTRDGAVVQSHVRGLQTHKQKLERALPGSRVAVNLAGVAVEQAARGSMIARPGSVQATTLVDVQLEMRAAPDAHERSRSALRHDAEVKVFCGAAMSLARVRLLNGDELAPGASGPAQLQLNDPLPLMHGDRFIVRLPSPSITTGGGVVLDAHPPLRYRRRHAHADATVLARLSALLQGTPDERLRNALSELRITQRDEAARKAQLDAGEIADAWAKLESDGVASSSNGWLALDTVWESTAAQAAGLLHEFHARQPLAEGMSKESLRSRMQLPQRAFEALLNSAAGVLFTMQGDVVRLSAHEVRLSPSQQAAADALRAQLKRSPWNTPLVRECKATLGDAVYDVLLRRRLLIQLNADVLLLPETYDAAVAQVRSEIEKSGSITAAQVRDLFSTTRKYALALLEFLDAAGVTRREGDARVLTSPRSESASA